MYDKQISRITSSIYSNKGAYVFLLGSGISKMAGVPTGWDITVNLVKQLACQKKVKITDTEVEKWFEDTFKVPCSYSSILEECVKTPTERKNLMKSFFESKEENKLSPSVAHKAIARLTKLGFVKVILTTNFDRLMEKALEDEGIIPTVIYDESMIDGATPYIHSDITIIKINGDYIDCRFRNTNNELEAYPKKMSSYLGQIFSQFGLITCGWSGEWDIALTQIMNSSLSQRYNLFYTDIKENTFLTQLAKNTNGEFIQIRNADNFLCEIQERIESLQKYNMNDNLSDEIIIARIKKYLSKEEYRIELSDLIKSVSNKTYNNIFSNANYQEDIYKVDIQSFTIKVDLLVKLLSLLLLWGDNNIYKLIVEIIQKFSRIPLASGRFYENTKALYFIPGHILFNTIGVLAIKNHKFNFIEKLFNALSPNSSRHWERYSLIELYNNYIYSNYVNSSFFESFLGQNYHYPTSIMIQGFVKPYMLEFIEESYLDEHKDIYDTFELLIAIYYHKMKRESPMYGDSVPGGSFSMRYNRNETDGFYELFWNNILDKKEDSMFLKSNLFISFDVFKELYDETLDIVKKHRKW